MAFPILKLSQNFDNFRNAFAAGTEADYIGARREKLRIEFNVITAALMIANFNIRNLSSHYIKCLNENIAAFWNRIGNAS